MVLAVKTVVVIITTSVTYSNDNISALSCMCLESCAFPLRQFLNYDAAQHFCILLLSPKVIFLAKRLPRECAGKCHAMSAKFCHGGFGVEAWSSIRGRCWAQQEVVRFQPCCLQFLEIHGAMQTRR